MIDFAAVSKVPVQYLSDVKRGSRSFTELFARRLQEEFGVYHLWLLGRSDSMQPPGIAAERPLSRSDQVLLPVFAQPIEGDPSAHEAWDGTKIEIVGAAVARSRIALQPYILRIVAEDRRGRLRPKDLVLVSQQIDLDAEIQLLKASGKALLARTVSTAKWEPLIPGEAIFANAISIGHVLGIVWAANG